VPGRLSDGDFSMAPFGVRSIERDGVPSEVEDASDRVSTED